MQQESASAAQQQLRQTSNTVLENLQTQYGVISGARKASIDRPDKSVSDGNVNYNSARKSVSDGKPKKKKPKTFDWPYNSFWRAKRSCPAGWDPEDKLNDVVDDSLYIQQPSSTWSEQMADIDDKKSQLMICYHKLSGA